MTARRPGTEVAQALAIIDRMGGPKLVVRIVAMFTQNARERVQRMATLLASDDRVQLSRLAHALKGSAAQVGAESLRDHCASLERDAVGLEPGELSSRVAAISAAAQDAIAMIEASIEDTRS